jgi:ATPase family associated with various cellular activities (AAA)
VTRRIAWDPSLADRLGAGLPVTVLGQLLLPAPLSRLLVLGRSDAERVALAAALVPGVTAGALSMLGFGRAGVVPDEVAARFPSRHVNAGFFTLDAEGRDQFLVAPGTVRQITVTCGLWPLLRQLAGPHAPARPPDAIAGDLDRLCELLDAILVAMRAEPTRNLVLRARGAIAAGLGQPTGGRPAEPYEEAGGEPTTFADVGGQDAARSELETICLAVREPGAFRAWGARPPRGVLLYGPPGTGKTLLARALAHESGARFLHVRATDVVSKWYGEAERRLQQAFDRARHETPAVLFFDEIDAIARDRDASHEATHRIVSTFLENMDGLREVEGVIVLAATNRPEAVDEALVRPGRFDRLVEVPLPDRDGRRAIFGVHMRRAEARAGRQLFAPPDDAAWARLLDASERFSGADVAETVRRALEAKVRAGSTGGIVTPDDLLAVAAGVARPF